MSEDLSELELLKKEVKQLRATVNFLVGYMNAKDPDFTYLPKSN